MEVHTILTRDALREFRKYMIKRNSKKGPYIYSVITFLLGLLVVAAGEYYAAGFLFILSMVSPIEMYILSWVVMRRIMRRVFELHSTDIVEGKIIFGVDKLKYINFVSKGEANISYSAMVKFAESQNYYAMFTKEHFMLIAEKQQFTPETEMQFLQTVREKMPQIIKGKKFKKM